MSTPDAPRWPWQHFAAGAGRADDDYDALWRWSTDHPARFWRALWEHVDVRAATGPGDGESGVLAEATMPGARWFPGVRLSYVDQVLRHADRDGAAIVGVDEGGARTEIAWRDLPGRVGAAAAVLRAAGVGHGDVVAGYLPDVAEAMVAFLAAASLGATWSACGQDYAPQGAAARLAQLRPRVLLSASGCRYGGTTIDRRRDTEELRDLLPGRPPVLDVSSLAEAVTLIDETAAGPLVPMAVPFDHPLWVLFSSGTTGRPKGLVHGHGGVLLEHLKAVGLHAGLGRDDVFFWHTALSWMMWNFRLAGLLVGATVLCYSGHPLRPGADRLWRIVADEGVTYFGTSPGHLRATRAASYDPRTLDLRALHTVGVTGSPLAVTDARWAAEVTGAQVAAMSGGTDVVTAFAGGTRGIVGEPGELATRYLGAALHSWDIHRTETVGRTGELVITAPMPSMPVSLWDDPDGGRYRAAYFSHEWADGPAPGVWRHGDWVTLTARGSLTVSGRSDATLNRHGVRMGSAEIYEVVESLDGIAEALVAGVDGPEGAYWMPLFVTLSPTSAPEDDAARAARIGAALRERLSARHRPDEVIIAPGIPHTRTGKKLEIPVRAVLAGRTEPDLDPAAVDDPGLLDFYRDCGAAHRW